MTSLMKMSPLEPQNVATNSRPPKLLPMNDERASTSSLAHLHGNGPQNLTAKNEADDVILDDDDIPPVLDRAIPLPESSFTSSHPSTSYSQYFPSLINPKPNAFFNPLNYQNSQQNSLHQNSLLFLQRLSNLYSNQQQANDFIRMQLLKTFVPKTEFSGKQSPSISIEIKETSNSYLENLMAKHGNEKKDEKIEKQTTENPKLEGPETDKQFDDEEFLDCPDLPPNLEKVENCDTIEEFESDDEPPKLELFGTPESNSASKPMVVLRNQNQILEPVPIKQTHKKPGRPRKKSFEKDNKKFVKNENSQIPASDALEFDKEMNRESSTSSGVSSFDDESPGCSPLAPINGNNRARSGRTQKDVLKMPSPTKGRKRKSESPLKEETAKKKQKTVKGAKKRKNTQLPMWVPVGKPFAEYVHVENESAPKPFCCYPGVKHRIENIVFHNGDVICVAAGENEPDNIGKINRIFRNKNGQMSASVFWYYRYDQCILKPEDKQALEAKTVIHDKELMASRHLDTISCDSIQSHAFVLTFSEYCRHVAENKFDVLPKRLQSRYTEMWPRGEDNYPRRHLSPHEDTVMDLVYFCRRYYSLDKKKIFKGFPNGSVFRKRQHPTKNPRNLMPVNEDTENQFIVNSRGNKKLLA